MSNKKFAIKITINVITLIILTVIMLLVFENTVVTNDIALGQMNNSDEAYLLMEYYNRVRTIVSTAYGCISGIIVGATIYYIYNFIKNKGES